MNFADLFSQAADGRLACPYRQTLATKPRPERLNVPTDRSKIAAVTLAWTWKCTQVHHPIHFQCFRDRYGLIQPHRDGVTSR